MCETTNRELSNTERTADTPPSPTHVNITTFAVLPEITTSAPLTASLPACARNYTPLSSPTSHTPILTPGPLPLLLSPLTRPPSLPPYIRPFPDNNTAVIAPFPCTITVIISFPLSILLPASQYDHCTHIEEKEKTERKKGKEKSSNTT